YETRRRTAPPDEPESDNDMKLNLLRILCLACASMASLNSVAGPLQRNDISAQAVWAIHVDCDILRPTIIGQYLVGELSKPEVQDKFAAFQSIFSFDPRKQLHGFTLYSTGKSPEDG